VQASQPRPIAIAIVVWAASIVTAAPHGAIAGEGAVAHDVERVHALRATGHFASAESLATTLLSRLEASPQPDSLAIASALFLRAVTRLDQGKYDDDIAHNSAERAFGIRSRRLGVQDPATAEAEVILAETLIGDPDSAVLHARHAIETYRHQPVHNDTLIATAWVDIGALENMRDQPRSALDALQRALDLRSKAYGPESMRLVSALSGMCHAWQKLGDFERAREYGERALRIVDRTASPTDRRRVDPLHALLVVDYRLGDWPQAIERGQECIDIAVACADTLELTMHSINLATIILEAGDSRGARELYMSIQPLAAKYTGSYGWLSSVVRQSLAEACLRTGDASTAMTLFREGEAEARRQTHPEASSTLALCVLGQASVLELEKRYREALELSRRGIALNDSARPPERSSLVTARTRHIGLLEAVGDTTGIDSMRAELARVRDQHGFAGTSMAPIIDHWLARADHDLGRDESAWKLALEADRGMREQLRLGVARLSDARALELMRRWPHVLGQVLLFAGMDRPERWETAWDRLVRTRGLVAAELARRRMPPALLSDTLVVTRHAAWVTAQRKLARQLVVGNLTASDSVGRAALAGLRAEVDRTEAAYARAVGTRNADSVRTDVGLADVRRALAPGSALVAFAEIEGYDSVRRMAAFIARAGESRIDRVEFCRSDSMRIVVDRWRDRLTRSPGPTEGAHGEESECRRLGADVRALVWEPVFRLTRGASSIALVPDGPIIDLPFHALPEARDR
jgi:tetratricopeptide (TPR) repeat protein